MNYRKYGYFFVAPFFIAYIIFGLYPAIETFKMAFYEYENFIQTDNFVGLEYISRAFRDPNVYSSILNSLKYWFFSTILILSTALTISACFTFFKIKGQTIFKSIFYLPSLASTAVVAILFSLFMGFPQGTINQLLLQFGLIDEPVMFIASPTFIFFMIIFIYWWMGFGTSTLTASAGMSSISTDYYEAALLDGAGFWKCFTKLTIPLMWPVLTFMFIASLIGGLQAFDIQFLLTQSSAGGPEGVAQTVAMYIYRLGFEVGNFGYASAISLILFFVISALSLFILRKMNKKGEQYEA